MLGYMTCFSFDVELHNIDFLSGLHFRRFPHKLQYILLPRRLSGLGCLKQRFSKLLRPFPRETRFVFFFQLSLTSPCFLGS